MIDVLGVFGLWVCQFEQSRERVKSLAEKDKYSIEEIAALMRLTIAQVQELKK